MSTETATNAEADATGTRRSNAYDIFMLVLTVLSLLIMVALILPLNNATLALLQVYDNLICVVFLGTSRSTWPGPVPGASTSSAGGDGWTCSVPSRASASSGSAVCSVSRG